MSKIAHGSLEENPRLRPNDLRTDDVILTSFYTESWSLDEWLSILLFLCSLSTSSFDSRAEGRQEVVVWDLGVWQPPYCGNLNW